MCLSLSGASRIPIPKLFGRCAHAGMNAPGRAICKTTMTTWYTLRQSVLAPILRRLLPADCACRPSEQSGGPGYLLSAACGRHGQRRCGDRPGQGETMSRPSSPAAAADHRPAGELIESGGGDGLLAAHRLRRSPTHRAKTLPGWSPALRTPWRGWAYEDGGQWRS